MYFFLPVQPVSKRPSLPIGERATLDRHHLPVASCYVLQCLPNLLPNPVRSQAKTSFQLLSCLAAARLAVTSCVFFYGTACNSPFLPFVTTQEKLIGNGIQRVNKSGVGWSLA